MRLPGIGSHHSAAAKTDEWLTPPFILEALGPFDLDPSAPAVQPWPTATRTFTLADDGLVQDWTNPDGSHPLVWLNPPYSQIEPWMARLADHGHGGGVGVRSHGDGLVVLVGVGSCLSGAVLAGPVALPSA